MDMAEAVAAEGEAEAFMAEEDTPAAIVARTLRGTGVDTLVATVVELLEGIGERISERIGVVTLEGIEVGTQVVSIASLHFEAVTLGGIRVGTMVLAIVLLHFEGLTRFMEEDTMAPGGITHIGEFLDFQCLAGLT